jgi:hypothetical protein
MTYLFSNVLEFSEMQYYGTFETEDNANFGAEGKEMNS